MITRDVLTVLQPAPFMFCYCTVCGTRYPADSVEWWGFDDHEQLTCHRCYLPIVLATERVIIDVVAE